MSLFIAFIWTVGFPFLYGLLISRLFGIQKPIDQWILVCLHISSTVLSYICLITVYGFITNSTPLNSTSANIVSTAIGFFVPLFVYHGLVWQFVLKDRKLNGFLISLICCSIYCVPFFFIPNVAKFL